MWSWNDCCSSKIKRYILKVHQRSLCLVAVASTQTIMAIIVPVNYEYSYKLVRNARTLNFVWCRAYFVNAYSNRRPTLSQHNECTEYVYVRSFYVRLTLPSIRILPNTFEFYMWIWPNFSADRVMIFCIFCWIQTILDKIIEIHLKAHTLTLLIWRFFCFLLDSFPFQWPFPCHFLYWLGLHLELVILIVIVIVICLLQLNLKELITIVTK